MRPFFHLPVAVNIWPWEGLDFLSCLVYWDTSLISPMLETFKIQTVKLGITIIQGPRYMVGEVGGCQTCKRLSNSVHILLAQYFFTFSKSHKNFSFLFLYLIWEKNDQYWYLAQLQYLVNSRFLPFFNDQNILHWKKLTKLKV